MVPPPDPERRRRRRSASGTPSPTKSPRKSTDRRRESSSPEKRNARDESPRRKSASPEKYTTPGESPQRKSASPEKYSTPGESPRRKSESQEKRTAGEASKRASGSHAKRASGGASKRNSRQEEKRRSHALDVRASGEKRRSNPPSPRKGSPTKKTAAAVAKESDSSNGSSSNALSMESLAKLNGENQRKGEKERKEREKEREKREKRAKEERKEREKEKVVTGRVIKERMKHKHRRKESGNDEKKKSRVVSGAALEAQEEAAKPRRGGYLPTRKKRRRWILWLVVGFVILMLIILVPVGVLVIGKQNGGGGDAPDNSNLKGISQDDIPSYAKGTYLDPFTWYDTQDFNVTFTNDTVGGLPVMGLDSAWDDSAQANPNVPPLGQPFEYGKMPIRGINVGGWLAIEPFVTPSMFNAYQQRENVVDEWSLCQKLGPTAAAQMLEKHYSSFINAQSFADIRDAGFDHVRVPFSYWAVTTYPGDPYVPKISWRYLLRGIEYARKNGLRVNLDLHGLPGSQNGWNHSGRQGQIGWLNGTDGALNGQRSLDLHKQLGTFFAQDRYKNVIGLYGLVNEPKMISLQTADVISWTTKAIDTVRQAGVTQQIVFADGFLGLLKWKGLLSGIKDIILDAHQYTIFNNDQIAFDHKTKLNFACAGWSGQMQQSTNTATGFGPTLCGEWSQADTDCTQYLNNVWVGSRWEGSLNVTDPSSRVLTPGCPSKNDQCTCDGANADPGSYTQPYKTWLLYNAIAQMQSFEQGWGWFYWTWKTESATQWSWQLGMRAGILPDKVWNRSWNCSGGVPDLAGQGLPENY